MSNANTTLILVVTMLIVTTGGVVVFYDLTHNAQQQTTSVRAQHKAQQTQDLAIVNVVGTNVSSEGVKYVQIQVRYDGSNNLDLNDTLIQLRTDKSVTDLQYRNGTTSRDVADGFYTQ